MHIAGSWILLIFAAVVAATLLLLLHLTRLGRILPQQIPSPPFPPPRSFFSPLFLGCACGFFPSPPTSAHSAMWRWAAATSITWCGASCCCSSPAILLWPRWAPKPHRGRFL